jgi:hypothetical protein
MKQLAVITGVLGLLFAGCAKKTDCIASIQCNDVNDAPIKGAKVFLFADCKTELKGKVRADLSATGFTDEQGKVAFTFKLPAVYDVSVSAGTQTATSIVKLEEGKKVEKVLIVR